MANENPELPEVIAKARSNKFTTVTTIGNNCVQALQKVVNENPERIVAEIKKCIPELLQTVVEVTFERSKLWSVIDRDSNLDYFRSMDYESWVNPGDLNHSELEKAKVGFQSLLSSPKRLSKVESALNALLDNSKKTLTEVEKCKKDIRNMSNKVARPTSCSENDSFRKRVVGSVEYLHVNIGKIQSMLQGGLDKCPMDLGKD